MFCNITLPFLQADDGTDRIHANDRLTVKSTIVDLMLKSPEQLQRQVCVDFMSYGKCIS